MYCGWIDNIKINLKEMVWKYDLYKLAQDRIHWWNFI